MLWLSQAGVPDKVVGDAGRLRQIMLNLLSNAVKFTPSGSVSVSVSTLEGQAAEMLHFEVTDTGIGLSREAQAKLFQAFTQADKSTTRRFGGTGLGLSISKRLVELMGGRIGLHSQLGEGTTFWFEIALPSLPTEKSNPASHRNESANRAKVQLRNLFANRRARILVADDSITNQRVAVGLLEQLGLPADAVANGAEAIQAIGNVPYSLILMDVHMPHLDGLDATKQIRQAELNTNGNVHLPIIALTAAAMREDQVTCRDAGNG